MKTDFLVIGSGIAGLGFALKAAKFGKVIVATKDRAEESNTYYAQGGLAAVLGKDDSFSLHMDDTLKAGDGLCNEKAVEILVEMAPNEIKWLESIGVRFDKDNGNSLGLEAAHSARRVHHVGDYSGMEVEKRLVEAARKERRINILEGHMAVELILDEGKCMGCKVFDKIDGSIANIFSNVTVLATGGVGALYNGSCNPKIATGDGIAIAYRAGALLMDMEFVQFHPTGLYGSEPMFLISESVRGEGGVLRNSNGGRFMERHHKDRELAPRDVVARAIFIEMKKSKEDFVFLDVTHLDGDFIRKRFPNIFKMCLGRGIDITKDKILVVPTAHYLCGGVKTDLYGRTSIGGLYAIGEASCNGAHGADRLASNSLPEGLVFGTRLLEAVKKEAGKGIKAVSNNLIKEKEMALRKKSGIERVNVLREQIKKIMWENAGIIRDGKGLKSALGRIIEIQKEAERFFRDYISGEILELRNMALVARVIIESAIARKESRGVHFRKDFPKKSGDAKHSIINKKGTVFEDL